MKTFSRIFHLGRRQSITIPKTIEKYMAINNYSFVSIENVSKNKIEISILNNEEMKQHLEEKIIGILHNYKGEEKITFTVKTYDLGAYVCFHTEKMSKLLSSNNGKGYWGKDIYAYVVFLGFAGADVSFNVDLPSLSTEERDVVNKILSIEKSSDINFLNDHKIKINDYDDFYDNIDIVIKDMLKWEERILKQINY